MYFQYTYTHLCPASCYCSLFVRMTILALIMQSVAYAYMSADMNRWMPILHITIWFDDWVCRNLTSCKLIHFWLWSGWKPDTSSYKWLLLYIMIWFSNNMWRVLTVKAWMDTLLQVGRALFLFFASCAVHWIINKWSYLKRN